MSNVDTGELTKISVVVPCLGHANELKYCLKALATQDIDSRFEVIVVDSGHDAAVEQGVRNSGIACMMRGERGLDAACARNAGADSANGQYLVFTDADCVPEREFLRMAESELDSGTRISTGPVIDADRRCIPACDNLLQFVDAAPRRPAGAAELAPGCNMAIRKQDFVALGGFRKGRAEDVQFCLDATDRLPGSLMFCPEMVVAHQGRSTWSAFLNHHKQFGFDRGLYGHQISPLQSRMGRLRLMILPVALKRFSYILRRTSRWKRERLTTVVLRSPILMAGLVAWAVGFRDGLIATKRAEERTDV